MKDRRTSIAVVLSLVFVGIALAFGGSRRDRARAAADEEHGGQIVFFVKKNRQNRLHVLFDHQAHIDAGHTCKDCHNGTVFKKEKKLNVNSFTMKDVMAGKACGACHDGKTVVRDATVFAPKGNCERCHAIKLRDVAKR